MSKTILVVFLAVVLLVLSVLIYSIGFALKKTKDEKSLIWYSLTPVLLFTAAMLSWFINFGADRLIATALCIPFIHSAAFLIISTYAVSTVSKYPVLKALNFILWGTYLLGYILLPTSGSNGEAFAFFRIIHNKNEILYPIANVLFLVNIAVMIIQIIAVKKMKNKNAEIF